MNGIRLKKCVIAIMVALCMPIVSFGQNRLLEKLPNGEGVSKVYIDKAMLNLVLGSTKNAMGNYASVFEEIDNIEIFTCDNRVLCEKAQKMIDKVLKDNKAETIIETEEEDESVRIYILKDKNGETIALVIYEAEGIKDGSSPGEINLVVLHGKNIDLEKLAGLIPM